MRDIELLQLSAARLYAVGVDLEGARERLRRLVERGVPYESAEMREAYAAYAELKGYWDAMEREHLRLRRGMGIAGPPGADS